LIVLRVLMERRTSASAVVGGKGVKVWSCGGAAAETPGAVSSSDGGVGAGVELLRAAVADAPAGIGVV
jgi:hypothetical protein